MPAVRIELLGGLRARVGARVVDRFPTRKTAALLAYLAWHGSASREALVELLWPDAGEAAGRTSLRKALSSLRRILEPPPVPAGAVLDADKLAVRLRSVTVDALELRDEGARALRARDARGIAAAIELYRGELLPGHDEEWTAPEREGLRRIFRDLVAARARALEGEDDVLPLLERALALDPLHEGFHHELARLVAARGDVPGALARVRAAEARIRRELDAPSPALRALAVELERRRVAPATVPAPEERPSGRGGLVTLLLAGESVLEFERPDEALRAARDRVAAKEAVALDLVASGDARGRARARALQAATHPGQLLASVRIAPSLGTEVRDRGLYRIHEGVAERVFEVASDEATPAPSAPPARTGSLPPGSSRFFGREAELSSLAGELVAGGSRLVTLTGPGGIGKTRLALEAATRAAQSFAGAAWFVPLAESTDAGTLAEAVARALGAAPDAEPLDAIARELGPDPALFVLDNLEQLGAKGALAVSRLLSRAAGATCLVTSREPLALESEVVHRLGPLELPRGGQDLARLRENPAVALFVDRARRARPDFEITRGTKDAVVELCRRLDGLPLAIELAASRAGAIAPSSMLELLDERLEALLASRRRDAPERHRTIAAAVAWSLSLLTDGAARAFARLAVLRGSFTAGTASSVLGEDVLAAIEELVASSLLEAEPGDERRFRFLGLVRAVAVSKLAPRERARLERWHARHFLAVAEGARTRLHGPEQAEAARELEREHDDLRAALAWSLGRQGDLSLGFRLGHALERFWNMRGHLREGKRTLDALLARKGAPQDLRARLLVGAGALAANLGALDEARRRFEQAALLLRKARKTRELAFTLGNLGTVAKALGDRRAALAAIEEAVALGRKARLGHQLAPSLVALATLATAGGDLDRATRLLEESAALVRDSGDLFRLEHSLFELGRIARARGDLDRAETLLAESLALCEQIGDERSAAYASLQRAGIALERGEVERAREGASGALATFERLGDGSGAGHALLALAACEPDAAAIVRLERARAAFGEGAPAELEVALAVALVGAGDPRRARSVLESAARGESREALEGPPLLEAFAFLLAREGRSGDAARLLETSRRLRETLGVPGSRFDRERRAALEAELDRAPRGKLLDLARALALATR
jgi:predicted ATPase/DNA-binding SARP family transcriptional activator